MVAIICECNPFHNGHQYLFETAKRLTGEPVLAIMSGSFTQRGEVAVCSKFERAKIALEHGADLVVELPTVCAVARAQRFAQGGVSIADASARIISPSAASATTFPRCAKPPLRSAARTSTGKSPV